MDSVFDALANGKPIKCLNVVEDFTKEAVVIEAARRINGQGVADVLEAACRFRGLSSCPRTDQGPEFTGRSLDQRAQANGVKLLLSQPGKPTRNAYVESFNGKFRDEPQRKLVRLGGSCAGSDLRMAPRLQRGKGPHSSLAKRTPAEFAATLRDHETLANNHPSDKLTNQDSTK